MVRCTTGDVCCGLFHKKISQDGMCLMAHSCELIIGLHEMVNEPAEKKVQDSTLLSPGTTKRHRPKQREPTHLCREPRRCLVGLGIGRFGDQGYCVAIHNVMNCKLMLLQ